MRGVRVLVRSAEDEQLHGIRDLVSARIGSVAAGYSRAFGMRVLVLAREESLVRTPHFRTATAA
jgi:hypothetical protein